MPTISIVIPAYNAERTILETIASVQKQTFSDIEIVVINDGSTDHTLELLENIEDDRLKVFSYENAGLSTARNRGIANTTGEFIAFLDSDDLWSPDKLECQLAALEEHPGAGVAYSWTYFMEEKNGSQILYPCKPVKYQGNVYAKLLVGDFIYNGSNALVRREAVQLAGGFDPLLKSCEDWDYWLRLAAKWHFVVVPKYQVFYRRSPGAMSSKVEVMRDACLVAIEKAFQAAPSELQFLKPNCMTSFNLYCASLYLQHGHDMKSVNQAIHHFWRAVCLTPSLLLGVYIYKQLAKLVLMWFVSPKLANRFLEFIAKFRVKQNLLS